MTGDDFGERVLDHGEGDLVVVILDEQAAIWFALGRLDAL